MNQTPLDDASPHPGSDRFDLGIDLGGTKTEIVVLDKARQPVYRKRVPTPAHRYADVIEMIVQLVGAAEAELGSVTRVGVGIPGAISPLTGQLRNSNTRCLNGKPLREDLERQLIVKTLRRNNGSQTRAAEILGIKRTTLRYKMEKYQLL